MTDQEIEAYIESTPKFTKKNSLANTRAALDALGAPDRGFRLIHVAGSNGKGSVCAYLASILEAAGKRTGLFTSPHLEDIRERFQMDRRMATQEEFRESFIRVMDVVQRLMKERPGEFFHPTYFELLFLMGMDMFARAGMEYVVLETGLGGRLDQTNAVERPLVTVLTSISLEHTEYLGDTYEQIAWEKAGIIKEGCPVVYDGTRADVSAVIEREAKKKHARTYAIRPSMYKILMNSQKTIDFSMDTGYHEPMTISIGTMAEYQVMNAMEAVTAAKVMDPGLPDPIIHRGMAAMRWQGRMETVLPGVIVDGAHNDSGVEEFIKTARRVGKDTRLTLLFSCVKEKDYEGMIREICEGIPFEQVIVTEVESDRRVPARELQEIFGRYTKKTVRAVPAVEEAFDAALRDRGDGILFCVGSLYLVGSLKRIIRSRENA